MANNKIVQHSILLRNGSRAVTQCYVNRIEGTDELTYDPVDKDLYRDDTRLDDLEKTYLLPSEGIAASEQYR